MIVMVLAVNMMVLTDNMMVLTVDMMVMMVLTEVDGSGPARTWATG